MTEFDALLLQASLLRQDFIEKTVIITGAGRGIGETCAKLFAWLGANVVIAEISSEGNQVAHQIQQNYGNAIFIQTDVSDETSVANMVTQTIEKFGQINLLINNAIKIPVCNVVDMDPALWDSVIDVNLRGTFLVSKACLPSMLHAQSGTIINMISTDAMPGLSAYIASKQGISGFSRSLAAEVSGQGVRVVAFSPGMVRTPGIESVAQDLAPNLGLTVQEFLNMPLHAAYDGLMPVEHAAIAAVYLAKNLTEKYNGEEVNGYEILEEAGIIHSAPSFQAEQPELAKPHLEKNDIFELLHALQIMINEISAEFEKLPIFIRPLARSGFKSKAGLSIQNWQLYIKNLIGIHQSNQTFDEMELVKRLTELKTYVECVPAETARFTQDDKFLSEVKKTCLARLTIIQSLKNIYLN